MVTPVSPDMTKQAAAFDAVSLDDKYALEEGRIFISGTQALVRLPMMQRKLDLANGLNTAGFISGYRGSPLGNYDAALWKAKPLLEENEVHFLPGVNEDLAATSCWGTQQVTLFPGARYDGVFSIWYGKGPGVDRSGDPLKHGNLAGTSPHGGVLVLAGDDHIAKSSTIAFQSEPALIAAGMPVFNPSDVQDYLDLGLHAFSMSRLAGVWAGFKCLTETIETTYSANVSPDRFVSVRPAELDDMPDLSITQAFTPVLDEQTLMRYRLPAAQAYVRANRLDRTIIDGERRTLGIVTGGKSFGDVRQALRDLGIGGVRARALGLRLYKVALSWPLEPTGLKDFAMGHDELLFVEEKRPIIQEQAAAALFHLAADQRPNISGKTAPDGSPLLATDGELSPAIIALAIGARLEAQGLADADIRQRMSQIKARLDSIGNKAVPGDIVRTPAFCSGCPHNTSTKVPEGSVSMAGIGCHTMAMWMPDRPTAPPTQMGGEGANWIGMAHFTDMQHVFQNMGDGTYFHSGLLAIRAAVAAQVNVTYKILFNSVVAMTGGQPFDGDLKITDIIAQVESEGVERIVVVSDEPDKYAGPTALPNSVSIHHRDALIGLEMELRDVPGVTVLIYDQGCATDKRRRRKRGQLPDPNTRYFINSDVCEGCGDCSTKSTCVSIAPKETPFGRKRRIDQSTCNKDYSCVKGFCPSFVTVTGARIRKRAAKPQTPDSSATMPKLPDPVIPKITDTYSLLVAGIGGTGVVTIGAVLGMAAHLENKGCLLLDITGLAQKNGAVLSHVQFAQTPADLTSARVGPAQCDLMLACDVIVGSGPEALATLDETRSHVVANMRMTATAQFQFNPNLELDGQRFLKRLATSVGQGKATSIDASAAAERLLGDSIGANMFLVGVAYQQGRIPVSEAAILRALELNGVAVSLNVEAFQYGRLAAHEGEAFWQRLGGTPTTQQAVSETLDDVIARRVTGLKDYQNARYAEQFKQLIDQVRQVDADIAGHDLELTKAAAKSLYKLMAYKDEYEVARLYSRPEFRQELEAEFEGDYKIGFNLAPPLLTRKDPVTGHPKKIRFGAWMLTAFGVLAHGKHLRGTAFDIFGRTSERRMERRLIAEYRTMLEHIMRNLSADNYAAAVALANVPDEIRGYGHVKEANVKKAEDRRAQLLQEFAQPKQRRTIMAAAG